MTSLKRIIITVSTLVTVPLLIFGIYEILTPLAATGCGVSYFGWPLYFYSTGGAIGLCGGTLKPSFSIIFLFIDLMVWVTVAYWILRLLKLMKSRLQV